MPPRNRRVEEVYENDYARMQQRSFQNLHRGKDKDSFKVDNATLEWPFTTKIIPDPIVGWSKLPIYDEYTEDGFLIVPKKNGCINNSQEPTFSTFSSKTGLVLTKRKSEEHDERDLQKGQTRLGNKITCVDGVSLMVSQSLGTVYDGDEAEKKFNYEECSKILMAANMETTTDWSTPPSYDEYPEEDVASEELKLLTAGNVPQFHPSNPTVNSNKRKVDDWDWLDESVLKQHTRIFETYGVIRGSECSFVMDSGSAGNYVSENLVSFLNLPTEDFASPYHVRWVNHETRKLVTKRCLVQFSIGLHYADRIWCDVMQMDSCDVLLGRPWQWDRNVLYHGRENVYELKVNGEPVKLFPRVEKMKREKTSFLAKEFVPYKKKKKRLYRVVANSGTNSFQPGGNDAGANNENG